jgi:hypothetical protein
MREWGQFPQSYPVVTVSKLRQDHEAMGVNRSIPTRFYTGEAR